MGRCVVIAAVLLLAGCGGERETVTVTTTIEAADWLGPPRADAAGNVEVARYNEFLATRTEPWTRSPLAIGAHFVQIARRDAARATVSVRDEGAGVTVLLDGLADDSIRSERWQLTLSQEDARWQLDSATWAQRCRPGRGHQGFSPADCL